MEKQTYTFPAHDTYGGVFTVIETLSGTFVCPGWHPVPHGTTMDQIKIDTTGWVRYSDRNSSPIKNVESKEWKVNGSKPGVVYSVAVIDNKWSCTCPASNFQRGDCKHIKAKKVELV